MKRTKASAAPRSSSSETALLGRGEGDVVEVEAPGGPLRLEILSLDG
jgi:transcription elongation GreA/GreB family factor